MRRRLIYTLVASALILLQLACGQSKPQIAPTPTKTPKPPETMTPTSTPSPSATPLPTPTDTPLPTVAAPTATPLPTVAAPTAAPRPTTPPQPPPTAPPTLPPTAPPTPPPPASPTSPPTAPTAAPVPASGGPALSISIDPREATPGDEVKIRVTAQDDDGVDSLEWGVVLDDTVMASDSVSCGDNLNCSLEGTMTVPLEGIFEVYCRATDSKGHQSISKDNLYVAK
jgi:hypothetical protein